MFRKVLLSLFVAFILLSPACFASDNSIHVFKLVDGHTVIIKEVHTNPIVTIDTWVKTGSINENNQNNGISHFLEHLSFKGTDKHKAGEFDKFLESHGQALTQKPVRILLIFL